METNLFKDFFAPVLQVTAGAAIAVLAEPARQWLLAPKLTLNFRPEETYPYPSILEDGQPNHDQGGKPRFTKNARVKVENTSRRQANNCRAYLALLQRLDEKGHWCDVQNELFPLAWGHQDKGPITIPGGTIKAFDVFFVLSGQNRIVPRTDAKHVDWDGHFGSQGRFRFHLLVTADWIKPVRTAFEFSWKGTYEKIEIADFTALSDQVGAT